MKANLIDYSEFIQLAGTLNNRNVVSDQAWVAPFRNELKFVVLVNDQVEPCAVAALWEAGKFGIRTWITPPFFPHIPLAWNSGIIGLDLLYAIDSLRKELRISFSLLKLPASFGRIPDTTLLKIRCRSTFQLLLTREQDVFMGIESKQRNVIRKAMKSGFVVQTDVRREEALMAVKHHYRRLGIPFRLELVDRLLRSLDANGKLLQVGVYKDNRRVWTGLFSFDKRVSYYLFGSLDREQGTNAASPLGVYTAICQLRNLGTAIFDFEGSDLDGVARFFRSFGSERVEYMESMGGGRLWRLLFSRR